MPKASWSLEVQERVRRFLQSLLSYALDYCDDLNLNLKYKWENGESDQPKLVIETQRKCLVELAEFKVNRHFYEAKDRLTDLGIFEDRRFHKKGKDEWHFALKLWSKDIGKNLREFDKQWDSKRPEKSKKQDAKKSKFLKVEVNNPPLEKIPSNIPYSGVTKFVGRSRELDTLHQLLQKNNSVVVTAIAGMGGVGKTELSIQYAKKYLNDYPGGVCWVLANASDVGMQIVEFSKVHFPKFYIPDGISLPAQVQFCWNNWPSGQVLVVIDNVTDYKQLKCYLPPQLSRFKILVTTRERLGAPFARLDVDVLKPLAAMDLLKSIITRERVQKEPWIARKLCKWVGFLPLGLELVGRYLVQDEDLSLAEMLKRLEKKRLRHKSLVEADSAMTAELGVADAFELSWELLDTDAQELACLLSLFALAPIPWSLVEVVAVRHRQCLLKTSESSPELLLETARESLENARSNLMRLHLLQHSGEKVYRLHQLIREFFREKFKISPQADNFKSLFIQVTVKIAKNISNLETLDEALNIASFIPHIQEVADEMSEDLSDRDFSWPFRGVIEFYQIQGLYKFAESWAQKHLVRAQNRLGSHNVLIANIRTGLGEIYGLQGAYKLAELEYTKALEIGEHLFGKNHSFVGRIQNSLALIYTLQGRYSESKSLYTKSFAIYNNTSENIDPKWASSFYDLALIYLHHGNYTEAERLLLKVLELIQSHKLKSNNMVMEIKNNLALVYQKLGRYQEAELLFRKCLEICQKTLGKNHPKFAAYINNYGSLYQDKGKLDRAEELYLEALEISRHFLGNDNIDVATTLNNLGDLYREQGYYDKAEIKLQEALKIRQNILGENHPDYANNLNILGLMYLKKGNYKDAEKRFRQALEIQKNIIGENHPDFANSLNNLAMLYFSEKSFSNAEELYLQSLKIRKNSLGKHHPHVANSLHNLAELYIIQGLYDKAESYSQEALEISQQALGENHPDTLLYRQSLNGLYFLRHQFSPQEIKAMLKDFLIE